MEAGLALEGLLWAEHLMIGHALVEGEDVVGEHAEPDHERAALHVVVDGDQEAERPDQVRGYVQEPLAVPQRFPDQGDLEVLQVAEAAVDQASRPARRPARDVPLVEQKDPEAAHRGVPGDPGPVDAGADDDQVEGIVAYVLGYHRRRSQLSASNRCIRSGSNLNLTDSSLLKRARGSVSASIRVSTPGSVAVRSPISCRGSKAKTVARATCGPSDSTT